MHVRYDVYLHEGAELTVVVPFLEFCRSDLKCVVPSRSAADADMLLLYTLMCESTHSSAL